MGQTVPLNTVFDKKKIYTIVMSGLVTITTTATGATETYDPFHGPQAKSCQKNGGGVGVNLQIKDAQGAAIEAADLYRPPVYTIPCRSDHRYEFQVNDGPVVWDLHGKATAYIIVGESPGRAASGSLKLVIKEEPPEPEATVLWGVRAREKKGLVATAHLSGRGLMETTEFKEGGFVDTAYLLPAKYFSGEDPHAEYLYEGLRSRDLDMEITSGYLIVQAAGTREERRSVRLIVEVVRSNKPGCPAASKTRRGARGKLVLIHYPRGAPDSFANAVLDLPCGVDEKWTDTDSDVTIRIEKLKKKR